MNANMPQFSWSVNCAIQRHLPDLERWRRTGPAGPGVLAASRELLLAARRRCSPSARHRA